MGHSIPERWLDDSRVSSGRANQLPGGDAPAEVQRFRGALFRQLRFGSSALTPCVKRLLKLVQAEMIRVASYRIPAIPSGLPGTWLLHETES
jgi:hypothetical protein